MKKRSVFFLFLTIVTLAALFRLWRLPEIPPGLYPDEALNGTQALAAAANADWKVFYPENNGREGLFINIQGLFLQVFLLSGKDPEPWMLRFPSALFGIATVIILYFLTKELFTGRRDSGSQRVKESGSQGIRESRYNGNNAEAIALLAAFFLAISFWHVNFSRIGFRVIMLPLMLELALLFLLRGVRAWKKGDMAFSGFLWGLGMYTYTGFRMAPLLAIIPLGTGLAMRAKELKDHPKKVLIPLVVFAATVLLTLIPLLGYFIAHSEDIVSRIGGISVFAQENPVQAFVASTGKTLLMLHVAGDGNWRHNFAGSPMLPTPVGILMLVGLALAVLGLLRSMKQKNWEEGTRWGLLLLWTPVMLLPVALTAEGIPHALRGLGTVPALAILSALGLWRIISWLLMYFSFWRREIALGTILFLLLLTIASFHRYFFAWAGSPHVPGAFRQDLVELSRVIKNRGEKIHIVVIVNEPEVLVEGIPMPAQTLMFLVPRRDVTYITREQLDTINPREDKEVEVVLMKEEEEIKTALIAQFPRIEFVREAGFVVGRLPILEDSAPE